MLVMGMVMVMVISDPRNRNNNYEIFVSNHLKNIIAVPVTLLQS